MKSTVTSVPSPVGGVNARDSLAAMPATDAITMDNWFPSPSYVSIRNGSELWASGLPTEVNTLMAYNGFTTRKLFAASGTGIFEVTVQGTISSSWDWSSTFVTFADAFYFFDGDTSSTTGITNDKLQHAMFNAGGGNFLIWVNGSDTPQFYDGTTGNVVTFSNLVGGSVYTNGTYNAVTLTGGSGVGATVNIVVSGNAVTSVALVAGGWGSGYVIGDVLTTAASNIGGTGSGFSIQVATVASGWHPCVMTGSGLNPANLVTITVHQQRCWYIEQNTMNVWYAAVLGFQGALTILPLGSLFKMGGTLMQMASWSIQNATGMSDYAAFITTEGEVAIYQGFDPSQSTTWSLVGVIRIGRPIGRRCYTKLAADIAVITADGLTSLNAAVLTDRTDPDKQLTYKILNAINQDVQDFNANFGWQVIDYPLGNKLIVNVPEGNETTAHQWVQNPISKSWCRFKNWNAQCWELQQDSLYYGDALGNVFLADQGTSDAGTAITVDCKPAFSYFDKPGQLKRFVMARPIFQANGNVQPTITMNIDFNDVTRTPITLNTAGGSLWNISPWGSPWDVGNVIIKNWLGIAGLGYVGSGRISFQSQGLILNWFSTDVMYEPGGPL